MNRCVFVMMLLVAAVTSAQVTLGDDIFTRRILPLAKADQPSSCRECHLSGVDLSQYILADEASTFAALRDAGLIDVKTPRESKLLQFIRRSPEKTDEAISRVRSEELKAFEEWITTAVRSPELLSAKAPAREVGPGISEDVIRYTRQDRVLQSFIEHIWIERERCAGCHDPTKNQRVVKEQGEHVSWISPDDPAGTLAIILEHGLIDLEAPEKSLILLKPLNEVEHGGHVKFPRGSRTDAQFREFLNDYANVVNGKYRSEDDLPEESEYVAIVAGQHLRLTDLPVEFSGKLLRVELHSKTDSGWSQDPVATADSTINPMGVWQNPVFRFVKRNAITQAEILKERNLTDGTYLARLYLDEEGEVLSGQRKFSTKTDFKWEALVKGTWKPGWREPMIVRINASAAK